MYRALDISRHIIKRCRDTETFVDNRKLQDLLYLIQGEFLADTGEECFPEPIEAWDTGPVVPEVYIRYLPFGSSDIPYIGLGDAVHFKKEDLERIDTVVDRYSIFPEQVLDEEAADSGPWQHCYEPHFHHIIPKEELLEWFSEEE
jgi:uncharacterized phage-associated protein